MSDASQSKYPIDFEPYDLDDVIPAEVIERAFGVSRESKEYRLKQLAMREAAARHFAAQGRVVTIRATGDDLHILGHAEASVYNEKAAERMIAGFARAVHRHNHVDVGELPDDDSRSRHTRAQLRNGRTLQAMRKARRECAKIEVKDTPRLVPAMEAKR